ncbi:MAG: GNAT family protein [Alphaproteobacteria bacterium]|nr:GNAT family protein [Alphaproteobacteria bacterium]
MSFLLQTLMALVAGERGRRCRASYDTILEGTNIILRMPDVGDWEEWTKLRHLSTSFLIPWEPLWPKDAVTQSFYMRQWRRFVRRWVQDREYAFLIFRREPDNMEGGLLGGITVTDIKRSVYQVGTLGYWMGAPFAGKGVMREAISLILPFAFEQLGLQRLEATVMPENERSLRLLRGLNFREIGLSKTNMQIEGAWRDQILFEKIK